MSSACFKLGLFSILVGLARHRHNDVDIANPVGVVDRWVEPHKLEIVRAHEKDTFYKRLGVLVNVEAMGHHKATTVKDHELETLVGPNEAINEATVELLYETLPDHESVHREHIVEKICSYLAYIATWDLFAALKPPASFLKSPTTMVRL